MGLGAELAAGGISCMVASAFFNPLDAIKTRLQAQTKGPGMMYTGMAQAFRRVYAEEGLRGVLFPGFAASMVREAVYSSIRMGLYPVVRRAYSGNSDGDPGIVRKVLAGLTTGAIGSALANPTDLVKIRIQGEYGRVVNGVYVSGLRTGSAPSYRNTLDAFIKIGRQEGLKGFYRGVDATMVRAALLTSGQLASYDHTKHILRKHNIMEESFALHIVGSLVAGLVATTASTPADVIKTRIMSDSSTGSGRYKGSLDCLLKTVRLEGPMALMKGWLPAYLRIGSHVIISLPLLEQVRVLFGLGNL